jgi:amino-acid N-acetyltransferase
LCAQGIRPARQSDLKAIEELLAPLERAGITKHRSRKDLLSDIPSFTIVERESKVRLSVTLCKMAKTRGGKIDIFATDRSDLGACM